MKIWIRFQPNKGFSIVHVSRNSVTNFFDTSKITQSLLTFCSVRSSGANLMQSLLCWKWFSFSLVTNGRSSPNKKMALCHVIAPSSGFGCGTLPHFIYFLYAFYIFIYFFYYIFSILSYRSLPNVVSRLGVHEFTWIVILTVFSRGKCSWE